MYQIKSVDGVWGSGTEKAIVKYAHGRSVTNIIKSLGKSLPAGANLSNAYFLMPEVSDNFQVDCTYTQTKILRFTA